MIWSVLAFNAQNVTTNQTVTSAPFETGYGRLIGFEYRISDATSGTYVSVTARILASADSGSTYLTPVDTAGAAMNVLMQVNSNSRYIAYDYDDLPVVPWTQVQLVSVTNQTITFDSVRLIYTDNG